MKRIAAAVQVLLLAASLCQAAPTEAPDTGEHEHVSLLESLLRHVDDFQDYWSYRTRVLASNVDRHIYETMSGDTPKANPAEGLFLMRWFDSYFIDQTYFDPSNRSYIRLLGGYAVGSKSDDGWFGDVRARIMIPRSEDRFQIFIGDETRVGEELSAATADAGHSGIGLRYLTDFFARRMRTSVSVGLAGIDDPYIRSRVYLPYSLEGKWLLEPVQTFRYSADKKFEEWTNLIIGRRFEEGGIAQLLLQRSTRSGEKGMGYFAEISYRQINRHQIGIKPYAALYGRTNDNDIVYDSGEKADEGIYNYALGVIWKRPVLRPYIFYQVHPAVEFHEQFDYEADYILRLSLELFIGEQ